MRLTLLNPIEMFKHSARRLCFIGLVFSIAACKSETKLPTPAPAATPEYVAPGLKLITGSWGFDQTIVNSMMSVSQSFITAAKPEKPRKTDLVCYTAKAIELGSVMRFYDQSLAAKGWKVVDQAPTVALARNWARSLSKDGMRVLVHGIEVELANAKGDVLACITSVV